MRHRDGSPLRRHGSTALKALALSSLCLLFSACENRMPREPFASQTEALADGGGGGTDAGTNTYVPPAELTNPLYLPGPQITAVQNICGNGFHYTYLGSCTDRVGGTFWVNNSQCNVTQASNVLFNSLTHCCIQCQLNANISLFNYLGVNGATSVQIAPGTSPGSSAAGTFTNVTGSGIWDAIVSAAGINACATNPVDLKGRPGFIAYTDTSGVLVSGSRSTFGYFINVTSNGQTTQYYVLFSYDKNSAGGCASEVFLFGPVVSGQAPALVMGLAVAANGTLLPEVPLDIADVSQYQGGASRPVQPGVGQSGQGCRTCHNRPTSGPNETYPFPWRGNPAPDAGTAPDAGGTAPDAGGTAPDAGTPTPDAGRM